MSERLICFALLLWILPLLLFTLDCIVSSESPKWSNCDKTTPIEKEESSRVNKGNEKAKLTPLSFTPRFFMLIILGWWTIITQGCINPPNNKITLLLLFVVHLS